MFLHTATYIFNVLCCTINHEKNLHNFLLMETELQSKVVKLWIQRKSVAAKLFTEALETNSLRDLRTRKAWVAHTKNVFVLFTPEEALSLFIEAHLTKIEHINFRIQAKMRNCNIYPSYHVIKACKV